MLHTWKILAGKINTFKQTKKTKKKKRKGVQNWNWTMKNASFNQQALSLKTPPESSWNSRDDGTHFAISRHGEMARKGSYSSSQTSSTSSCLLSSRFPFFL